MEEEMMEVWLQRIKQNDKQTQGILIIFGSEGELRFAGNTIELPWRQNVREISCIPKGTYRVLPRNSEKYGQHYILQEVPGRDLILLHPGNYHDDTRGCILPGVGFGDIDNDGYLDVLASRVAMQKIRDVIGQSSFNLTIKGV